MTPRLPTREVRMSFISGPCVLESRDLAMTIASALVGVSERLCLDFVFKGSFDKANRSSIHSYRGPGIDDGLRILDEVKHEFGIRVTTDVHEPWQAAQVADVVDILQIPAFLCRQTDLLVASARTGRAVNVKKGQFMAPHDMTNVILKLRESNAAEICLTERGTSFGYNRLVVDMTGIAEMKRLGFPVIFDVTHSCHLPGGKGTSTDGNRRWIEPLALAAVAAGADGLFMETHPNPDDALSDGPNSIPLAEIEGLLRKAVSIRELIARESSND